MTTLIGFLGFALFIALIVGLIKPSTVLRWDSKPTRLKVFGYWILSFVVLGILSAMSETDEDRAANNIQQAKNYIEQENYSRAVTRLEDIDTASSFYQEAQELIKKADSLNTVTEEQKRLATELEAKQAAEEELKSQKEQLEREIKAVNNGVDFSTYRGSVDALQLEIVLFGTWANIITEGENSEDPQIKRLAKQLKPKIVNLQVSEFPKMRQEYAKVVANLMWEHDVYVNASGSRNVYLNFVGVLFAANKNIKDAQEQLQDAPKLFRFKQTRYRWYKEADEYTYYTTYEGTDSDLVDFSQY
ncbi:hypothetical protein [uncultured Imperialibacter sp.]|uniref:hypothetical protein n=1 Tax=uncultured Imperialibacter sp. TaxID=1672639 RepID=UPI0030DA34B1|tara:strand:- start:2310 stop:3215 length:906 start_codon:yes stop_codon:yes gene_type:complete